MGDIPVYSPVLPKARPRAGRRSTRQAGPSPLGRRSQSSYGRRPPARTRTALLIGCLVAKVPPRHHAEPGDLYPTARTVNALICRNEGGGRAYLCADLHDANDGRGCQFSLATCSRFSIVALQMRVVSRDGEVLQVRSSIRATLAAGGVVVSVAAGVVTNLITAKWSWSLVIVLAGLVICAAALAGVSAVDGARRKRTVVRQRARGGRVVNSIVEADAGATVEEVASGSGQILDVHTRASGAEVRRVAKEGTIEGGSITAG